MATYFMRHGEIFGNSSNAKVTVKEATEKISLSVIGKQQVREANIPSNLDYIVISDSLRTRQSAEIIVNTNKLNVPIRVESDLYPWESGADDWNTYMDRYEDFIDHYNPNGPYENKDHLRKRVQKVLDKYRGKNILVVAHSILLANYIGKQSMPYAEVIRIG